MLKRATVTSHDFLETRHNLGIIFVAKAAQRALKYTECVFAQIIMLICVFMHEVTTVVHYQTCHTNVRSSNVLLLEKLLHFVPAVHAKMI